MFDEMTGDSDERVKSKAIFDKVIGNERVKII